jgi:hypothetical protein
MRGRDLVAVDGTGSLEVEEPVAEGGSCVLDGEGEGLSCACLCDSEALLSSEAIRQLDLRSAHVHAFSEGLVLECKQVRNALRWEDHRLDSPSVSGKPRDNQSAIQPNGASSELFSDCTSNHKVVAPLDILGNRVCRASLIG